MASNDANLNIRIGSTYDARGMNAASRDLQKFNALGQELQRGGTAANRFSEGMAQTHRMIEMNHRAITTGNRALDEFNHRLDRATLGMFKFTIAAIGIQQIEFMMLPVAMGIGQIAKESINAAAQMQMWQKQLEKTNGSMRLAKKELEFLFTFAKTKSPFDVDKIVEAAITLQNLGISAEEAQKTFLPALNDMASASQGKGRDMVAAALAMVDGIHGQFKRLNDTYAITDNEVKQRSDSIRKTMGGMSEEMANKIAILQIIQAKYGGMAAAQMDTLQTAASNLREAFFGLKVAIGQALTGDNSGAAIEFVKSLQEMTDSITEFVKTYPQLVQFGTVFTAMGIGIPLLSAALLRLWLIWRGLTTGALSWLNVSKEMREGTAEINAELDREIASLMKVTTAFGSAGGAAQRFAASQEQATLSMARGSAKEATAIALRRVGFTPSTNPMASLSMKSILKKEQEIAKIEGMQGASPATIRREAISQLLIATKVKEKDVPVPTNVWMEEMGQFPELTRARGRVGGLQSFSNRLNAINAVTEKSVKTTQDYYDILLRRRDVALRLSAAEADMATVTEKAAPNIKQYLEMRQAWEGKGRYISGQGASAYRPMWRQVGLGRGKYGPAGEVILPYEPLQNPLVRRQFTSTYGVGEEFEDISTLGRVQKLSSAARATEARMGKTTDEARRNELTIKYNTLLAEQKILLSQIAEAETVRSAVMAQEAGNLSRMTAEQMVQTEVRRLAGIESLKDAAAVAKLNKEHAKEAFILQQLKVEQMASNELLAVREYESAKLVVLEKRLRVAELEAIRNSHLKNLASNRTIMTDEEERVANIQLAASEEALKLARRDATAAAVIEATTEKIATQAKRAGTLASYALAAANKAKALAAMMFDPRMLLAMLAMSLVSGLIMKGMDAFQKKFDEARGKTDNLREGMEYGTDAAKEYASSLQLAGDAAASASQDITRFYGSYIGFMESASFSPQAAGALLDPLLVSGEAAVDERKKTIASMEMTISQKRQRAGREAEKAGQEETHGVKFPWYLPFGMPFVGPLLLGGAGLKYAKERYDQQAKIRGSRENAQSYLQEARAAKEKLTVEKDAIAVTEREIGFWEKLKDKKPEEVYEELSKELAKNAEELAKGGRIAESIDVQQKAYEAHKKSLTYTTEKASKEQSVYIDRLEALGFSEEQIGQERNKQADLLDAQAAKTREAGDEMGAYALETQAAKMRMDEFNKSLERNLGLTSAKVDWAKAMRLPGLMQQFQFEHIAALGAKREELLRQRGMDITQVAKPGGFAAGGFTGNVDQRQVAGVVHGGEYVIPKRMVDRNQGMVAALEQERVRGYAKGGIVPGAGNGEMVVPKEKVREVAQSAMGKGSAMEAIAGLRAKEAKALENVKKGKIEYTETLQLLMLIRKAVEEAIVLPYTDALEKSKAYQDLLEAGYHTNQQINQQADYQIVTLRQRAELEASYGDILSANKDRAEAMRLEFEKALKAVEHRKIADTGWKAIQEASGASTQKILNIEWEMLNQRERNLRLIRDENDRLKEQLSIQAERIVLQRQAMFTVPQEETSAAIGFMETAKKLGRQKTKSFTGVDIGATPNAWERSLHKQLAAQYKAEADATEDYAKRMGLLTKSMQELLAAKQGLGGESIIEEVIGVSDKIKWFASSVAMQDRGITSFDGGFGLSQSARERSQNRQVVEVYFHADKGTVIEEIVGAVSASMNASAGSRR